MSDNPADNGLGTYITNPTTLSGKILEWKAKGFHVMSPAIQVSTFTTGYGVNPSLVLLDTSVDANGRGLDVYYDKRTMKVDERGLGKIALGKLASSGGVSWIGAQSGRRDPLTIQNLWIYQMVGVYLTYDGTPQVIHGEKEIDYRDGSAQIDGWTSQRILQGRVSGAERSETGAMERAIRMGFGIKHVYTLAELSRPFVALRVCSLVDMGDPDVRRMVTAGKLAGVASLYAGARRRELPESTGADVIDIATVRRSEPVPVRTAPPVPSNSAAPAAEPSTPAPSQTTTPPPPVASTTTPSAPVSQPTRADILPKHYIRQVTREERPYGAKHAKAGQTFIKFRVIDGDGVEHVTIRTKLGEAAEKALSTQSPVTLLSVPNSFREQEIVSIDPLGATAPAAAAPADIKL